MRELLVLTLALLTVGCTAAVPAPPPAAPPVTELPLPTPRPEGPPKPLRTPVPRPEHAEPEPFRLEQLGGASEIAVVGMIGPPDEVRERPPGKVWVYNHGPCRVEVYLYPSVDVGSMAVLGSALAPDSLADDDRDRCRRSLARRTAKAP
ncbi:MAG TPA: hypothetical protein VIR38_06355 [Thalassobaculum sp.]